MTLCNCMGASAMELTGFQPFLQKQIHLLHFRSSGFISGIFRPHLCNPKSTQTKRRCRFTVSACLDSSQEPEQRQLNFSVMRFTFGIPGLDESYLPRYIGFAFGSLLLLNHFAGSNSVASAQLRTEALGLCLAAFSVSLPYIGSFLKGANPIERPVFPQGNRQIFVMPEDLSDGQKEELAWVSYALLRNSRTMSVLISVQHALCIRGFWNIREDASKVDILQFFEGQIQQLGFSNLMNALYFSQGKEHESWVMLPEGAISLLVQPLLETPDDSEMKWGGFVLLVSNLPNAYSIKDRAWIRAIAKKFSSCWSLL